MGTRKRRPGLSAGLITASVALALTVAGTSPASAAATGSASASTAPAAAAVASSPSAAPTGVPARAQDLSKGESRPTAASGTKQARNCVSVPTGGACLTGDFTWTKHADAKTVNARVAQLSNFSKQLVTFTGSSYVWHSAGCNTPVAGQVNLGAYTVLSGYTAKVTVKAPAKSVNKCPQFLSGVKTTSSQLGHLNLKFTDPATPKLAPPVTVKNPAAPSVAAAGTYYYTRSGVCTVIMSPYPSYQSDVTWGQNGYLQTQVYDVKYWAGSSPYKIQQQDWQNSTRLRTWGWTGWLTYSAFTHTFNWPFLNTTSHNHWTRMGAYYGSKYCFADVSDGA
jgi:hypothetical protein